MSLAKYSRIEWGPEVSFGRLDLKKTPHRTEGGGEERNVSCASHPEQRQKHSFEKTHEKEKLPRASFKIPECRSDLSY